MEIPPFPTSTSAVATTAPGTGSADSMGTADESSGTTSNLPEGTRFTLFDEEMMGCDETNATYVAYALPTCTIETFTTTCDPDNPGTEFVGIETPCGEPAEVVVTEPGHYLFVALRHDDLELCFVDADASTLEPVDVPQFVIGEGAPLRYLTFQGAFGDGCLAVCKDIAQNCY